ncbi:MAG: phenylalanine--tRNA ligase subunit alpha, partial [Nitrososphaerales archaeon]
MTFDPKTLHEIERKLILALANGKLALEDLTKHTSLSIDQVRRGIEWLKYKNLISVNERVIKFLTIGSEGARAVEHGPPERRLVNTIASTPTKSMLIEDAKKMS